MIKNSSGGSQSCGSSQWCQIADALGVSCAVETAIFPIDPYFRICGPAFYGRMRVRRQPDGPPCIAPCSTWRRSDCGRSHNCDGALWGELMSISAQSRGVVGTIIDGPVRDPLEIRTLGYPVFCRHSTPAARQKKYTGTPTFPLELVGFRLTRGISFWQMRMA